MQRRTLIRAVGSAVATLGLPRLHSQEWPGGPVRIIVGFPPGGGTDALARVVAQKLTGMWGQRSTSRPRPASPVCSRQNTCRSSRATAARC